MTLTPSPAAHSAAVRLWMICDGRRIELAQIAPAWVIPTAPVELPPCEATVFLEVDGRESSRRVYLAHGMSLDSEKTLVDTLA